MLCDDYAMKTKIMYKAFLSHAQLREFLVVLTESDLLRYDKEMRTFKTSEKGLSFLKTHNQIDQLMNVQQI
jgi:predicted transcriptional regulator